MAATFREGSFRAATPAVQSFRRYLTRQQSSVAQQYSVAVQQRYTVATNGFSAHLTATQARGLAKDPRVLTVVPDALVHLDRVAAVGPHATSEFLGLTHHGRPAHGWNPKTAGRGVVIGMIDSGIWPENPAFAGKPLHERHHVGETHRGPIFVGASHKTAFLEANGHTFHGRCQSGQRFPGHTCNTKLISARYYDAGLLQSEPRRRWSPAEFASARDGVGHGSHTSSTAAGDYGVRAKIHNRALGRITGVAPAAKIAVYKVLWATAADPFDASGTTSDIVAGIDQAVGDGVNVINYSIGPQGGDDDIVDPIAMAFLNAAAAGVFVATAAGNDGPSTATVSNVSPWVTTAAASTWRNPNVRHTSRAVPRIAGFSSRGPSQINADVLKPDVAAPGVRVLAAVAPPSNGGLHFDFYDGTSMASPHVAGLAAWMLGKRPHLRPGALRSMFMTTAHDTVTGSGHKLRVPFRQGAGQVSPSRMGDPGLVFPAGLRDWLAWLEGQGIDTESGVEGTPGYDLNEPSIQVSSLVSSVTVTRRVKNVSGHRETYAGSYVGGSHVAVSFEHHGSYRPRIRFTIGAGKVRLIHIRMTTVRGVGSFASGSVLLVSKEHRVRIPVEVRPLALSVDPAIEGSGASGTVEINGKTGSDGTVTEAVEGLVGATPTAGSVHRDGGSLKDADITSFTVPSGTSVSRIDLDAHTGSTDLDLYLFADDGTSFNPKLDPLVSLSASTSRNEQLLGHLPAGDYWIAIDGYDVDPGGGAYELTKWNVANTDAGNLDLDPVSQPTTKGAIFTVTGTYTGLDPSKVYFGQSRSSLGTHSARTLITIRP